MQNVNINVDEQELNRLASRLDNVVKSLDPYAYADAHEDGENAFDYLLSDPYGAIDFLLDMVDELMN